MLLLFLIYVFPLTTLASFPSRLALGGSCMTLTILSYPLSSLKTPLSLSNNYALTSHALLRSAPMLSFALALNCPGSPLPFSLSSICPLCPIDLFICDKTRWGAHLLFSCRPRYVLFPYLLLFHCCKTDLTIGE